MAKDTNITPPSALPDHLDCWLVSRHGERYVVSGIADDEIAHLTFPDYPRAEIEQIATVMANAGSMLECLEQMVYQMLRTDPPQLPSPAIVQRALYLIEQCRKVKPMMNHEASSSGRTH